LLPNDEILTINGTSTSGKAHGDIIALFGTGGDVVLTVRRPTGMEKNVRTHLAATAAAGAMADITAKDHARQTIAGASVAPPAVISSNATVDAGNEANGNAACTRQEDVTIAPGMNTPYVPLLVAYLA